MTLNPFGRALSPVEISSSRYLDALIAFRPLSCLRMEDDGGSGEGEGGSGDTGAGQSGDGDKGGNQGESDKGYPADTKVADMTPPQQAAYWQAQAQKHEGRNKDLLKITGGKYGDDLKSELDAAAKLREATLTENERAVEQAKATTRAEVAAEFATKLVAAEFRGALAHVPEERRDQIIENLALDKFLTTDGDVDTAKVTSHVKAIAPGKGTGDETQDYGQGRRGGGAKTSSIADGAQLYADRRGKSTSTS